MPPMIDSHQHFWDLSRFEYPWMQEPELEPLRRNYLPSDLEPLLRPAAVDRTVFVQAQHNLEESRWVLDLAERHEFLAGVVGWVDLASEACEEQLLELRRHPAFVGARHITHDEPDDDWIVREDVLRGLKVLERHGVPFDLLFRPRHLRHVPTLMEGWREDFEAAARHPNVYCKLSGMATEADWEAWAPSDFAPYVRVALEAFGPGRLMFGSDWPVSTLCASYEHVVSALRHSLGPISTDEREQIFGGTAERFYGLKPPDEGMGQ
jgi:L-fuconolactonase